MPYALESNLFENTAENRALFIDALPMLPERITRLTQVPSMLEFLFADTLTIAPSLIAKYSNSEALDIVNATRDCIDGITEWNEETIHEAMKVALVDNLGIKARVAFAVPRVALTGSEISPPLFKSIELLGKEASLARFENFKILISR